MRGVWNWEMGISVSRVFRFASKNLTPMEKGWEYFFHFKQLRESSMAHLNRLVSVPYSFRVRVK